MKEALLRLFEQLPALAVALSLLISIIVAVLGLVPSFFVTAANLLFFGFWEGTLLSFCGEAAGAATAFLLYRKGFKSAALQGLQRFPKVKRLLEAEKGEAFTLVLALRLVPFVPSGLVTLAAAVGRVSTTVFLLASSLGKIPALLLEAYSVTQVTAFGWQGKLILLLVAAMLLYLAWRQWQKKEKRQPPFS